MKKLKEYIISAVALIVIVGSLISIHDSLAARLPKPRYHMTPYQHPAPSIIEFFFPQNHVPFHSVANQESVKEPGEEGIAKVYAASFALYGQQKGDIRFLCTATIYAKIPGGYLLLSAGHCIEGNPEDIVYSVAENFGQPRQSVKVIKWLRDKSTNIDFAVLELKTDKEYPVLSLDIPMTAGVGDEIIAVDFGNGLGKQYSRGTITSRIIKHMETETDCDICMDNFYYGMIGGMGPGSSGAALVSLKTGKIVGLAVGYADSAWVAEPISRFSVFVISK